MHSIVTCLCVLLAFISALEAQESFQILYRKETTLFKWNESPPFNNLYDDEHNFASSLRKHLINLRHKVEEMNDLADLPIEITKLFIYTRDGIKLSTFIVNTKPYDKPKTMLLSRSPYGPTSDQLVSLLLLAKRGEFVAVIQDQRGTGFSEGRFNLWKNESTDAFDTMEFFQENKHIFPWFNGKVYSAGISADGCSAVTQVLAKPEWLKGQWIIWATGDAHDSLFPGGSFREGLITGWMTGMALLTDGVSLEETLTNIKQHEAKSAYYDMISMDDHTKEINYPTVHLSGWWDIFTNDHIKLFNRVWKNSHPSVRQQHRLVVGPLGHCAFHEVPRLEFMRPILWHEMYGWTVSFRQALALFSGNRKKLHEFNRLTLFVQGPYHHKHEVVRMASDEDVSSTDTTRRYTDEGNFWIGLDNWPSLSQEVYYLSSNGRLELSHYQIVQGSSTYIYNPVAPTITDGGNNFIIDVLGYRCGSQDQKAFELRDDSVVFTSAPLVKSVGVCGRVSTTLFVSSDRNTTDFVVSLTDVYFDDSGLEKSMLVRRGVQNMKWRDSISKAELMEKGKRYEIEVDLGYTCYIFNKGHRIRVSVTSSNWPMYAVNKNTLSREDLDFLNNNKLQDMEHMPKTLKGYSPLSKAETTIGLTAENTIFMSESMPSRVSLPFVDVDKLRKHKL